MIYLYLFGTCFHFIYVFMIIGKYGVGGYYRACFKLPFDSSVFKHRCFHIMGYVRGDGYAFGFIFYS